MYGLVNRAMEEMVLLHHGADVWNQIKAKAEVDIDIFIANDGYPDEITYRLATAAADTLALPIEQVLHAFGEHWILEVGSKSYSGMMEAGGRTFPEFLANLPRFHDRVSLAFPHLSPPSFRVDAVSAAGLRLTYITERPGLAHFVLGLLSGLSIKFAQPIQCEHVAKKADGAPHDVFEIKYVNA